MSERIRVGIVGARGYVGGELVRLLARHPVFELAFVSSRELAGQALATHIDGAPEGLSFERLEPAGVAGKGAEAVVLALPNGHAVDFVAAVLAQAPGTVLIDLSADHRFDEAWYYGLPELTRAGGRGRRLIANPGCYATAMQLAIAPMHDALDGAVQSYGVSGWSGAGTSPSDKNDPDKLRDNLMPYALVDHLHEREVTRQLAHPVEFMPHVAAHFRGITLTANLHLSRPFGRDEVLARFHQRYAGEPLVDVVDAPPWVSRTAGRHGAQVGGFTLSADGCRLVVVATLDNLFKGAATQALQNLNLAFGLDETCGIPVAPAGAA